MTDWQLNLCNATIRIPPMYFSERVLEHGSVRRSIG